MIVATLARCHGEISSTARELQVSRTTMWRLMKKHGIEAGRPPVPSLWAAGARFTPETHTRFIDGTVLCSWIASSSLSAS